MTGVGGNDRGRPSRSTQDQLRRDRRGERGGERGGERRGDRPTTAPRAAYPGDFTGTPELTYAPNPDGQPDPGEIVWTWVPFEEDYTQGKDRPVLVVGHDLPWLLALMLTSKDHDRDKEDEARRGRYWVDIGSGAWDSRGRPSEVRVDRILRVDAVAVRREGAVLDQKTFELVAEAVRTHR
ncbi:type II toxin-antitoxin system PemK/MazF family toxin [Knoellia sp. DB2414S]|uniref:Type II toxin-antitoxin system PemK/MazF family toxin n=1 Tax=Knoellia koreensis TaxID=2730921 RepID=A0A849H3V8_9MICO|nr:type II toxin-antitoxin system PemK/MazF family toxin [Knoellia sp. DB2414S]NNM44480.1 type II toxin-antitoxin system PemK/MazF family toxin [Knoellia sp. DB2414S]